MGTCVDLKKIFAGNCVQKDEKDKEKYSPPGTASYPYGDEEMNTDVLDDYSSPNGKCTSEKVRKESTRVCPISTANDIHVSAIYERNNVNFAKIWLARSLL